PPAEEDRILRLYHGRAGLGHPLDILGPTQASKIENPGSRLAEEARIEDGGSKIEKAAPRSPNPQSSILDPRSSSDSPSSILGISRQALLDARQALAGVNAKMEVCSYIGQIVRQTRELDQVLMGASSRAAVHLLQAAKARALMSGRQF